MRLNWKGRGRKINGDYILDWDREPAGNTVWYRIMNYKTGIVLIEMVIE